MKIILALLLAFVVAVPAFGQVTATNQVTVQWDAAGQSQRVKDANGFMWTFTATVVAVGVVRLMPDGTPQTPGPLYPQRSGANPPVATPIMSDAITVAEAAFMIQGRNDIWNPTSDKFKMAVQWSGWALKDGETSPVEATTAWALSVESVSLVATDSPPTQGTFTIYGGVAVRIPTAPTGIVFRQQ